MMALVSKDLYSARSGIGVILLFAVVFGVLFRDTWTGPMIVTLLFANIGNSTLTWDEQCQWNTFAVSSGISRRTLVLSKFQSGMVFVVVGAVVGLIVSAAFTYSGFSDIPLDQSIQGVVLGAIVSAAVMGVTVSVTYWTGDSAKVQYLSIGVMVVIIIALVAGSTILTDLIGASSILVAMVVLAVLMLVVTFTLSVRKLESRDL